MILIPVSVHSSCTCHSEYLCIRNADNLNSRRQISEPVLPSQPVTVLVSISCAESYRLNFHHCQKLAGSQFLAVPEFSEIDRSTNGIYTAGRQSHLIQSESESGSDWQHSRRSGTQSARRIASGNLSSVVSWFEFLCCCFRNIRMLWTKKFIAARLTDRLEERRNPFPRGGLVGSLQASPALMMFVVSRRRHRTRNTISTHDNWSQVASKPLQAFLWCP